MEKLEPWLWRALKSTAGAFDARNFFFFFWRRCWRSVLREQKVPVCPALSPGGVKCVQWFQRFAFPQDLFAGIRPAFLCFRGWVCAPCPVAQGLGEAPDCNSLPLSPHTD